MAQEQVPNYLVSPGVDMILIGDVRMPSRRTRSLGCVQMAAAFQRSGARAVLFYSGVRSSVELSPGQDLFSYYCVPAGPRPELVAIPSVDWVDRMLWRLQFARVNVQKFSFSRKVAARVVAQAPSARVYINRDVEVAHALVRRGHASVFLEVHRVPEEERRRRRLLEAAAGARGVVAISGGVREELLRLGVDGGAVVVEHSAFEASRLPELTDQARRAARERLRIPSEARVVVYAGSLDPDWGTGLLVDAARACPAYLFVIVGGEESEARRLRELAAGLRNVRIEGFQPPARVSGYLLSGDAGAVPYRSGAAVTSRYTSPLKVFESMAVGLPLVASDLPSLREILNPERDAVMVAPDDAGKLAEGIHRLMGDGALRARLRARSLERACKHTWDERARRLLGWMDGRLGLKK